MTHDEDFLDETVRERSVRNPAFSGLVEAAYERRIAARAEESRGKEAPEASARAGVPERGDT
jgi:hypothetical protein